MTGVTPRVLYQILRAVYLEFSITESKTTDPYPPVPGRLIDVPSALSQRRAFS
jgi:hypothetical protein